MSYAHNWLALNWQALTTTFPQTATADQVFAQLVECYSEHGRAYHNLAHIQKMLTLAVEYAHLAVDWTAVQCAIWFHDAIYVPGATDNEERSAAFAKTCCGQFGLPPQTIQKIETLILATKHQAALSEDKDSRFVLDLDLSILGASSEVYKAYVTAVRQEFAHVAETDFVVGRTAVLQSFLRRERIYQLDPLYDRFEKTARENISIELHTLSS